MFYCNSSLFDQLLTELVQVTKIIESVWSSFFFWIVLILKSNITHHHTA